MKCVKQFYKKIKDSFDKITLIDKCLILIMTILMLLALHNLFGKEINVVSISPVDTLIRTTMASIFGYFLSSNFAHNSINSKKEEAYEQIKEKQSIDDPTSKQQIIIATVIAIVSIFAIFAAKQNNSISSGDVATLSQFRDFISGGVGFLLGCPPKK